MKKEQVPQVSWEGARGGIAFKLLYTTDKAGNCDNCPFGRGWTHNWDVRLSGSFTSGGAGRLIMPEEVAGRLYSFSGTDSSGALTFASTATVSGLAGRIIANPSGVVQYRRGDGTIFNFNSAGRLISKVSRNGNITTLTYSGGNLTQITDPVGRSLTFVYDGSNRVISMTDPLGRAWHYTYEGTPGVAGVPGLTTVTDPAGNVTKYSYVTGGRIASVTDPRGNLVKQLTYDASGRVATQTFADGGNKTYNYSLSGTIVTGANVTDQLGKVRSMRFSANGYVIGTIDELGQTSVINRDLTTNVALSVSGPCGCKESTNTFDANGNKTSATDLSGNQESWQYDPSFNHVTQYVDRRGNVTTHRYDSRGNLVLTIDASQNQFQYGRDSFGRIISTTDPLGHVVNFAYDQFGEPSTITDALNNSMTLVHDAVGRLVSTTDPLQRTITYEYDALSRRVAMTDPAGTRTQYDYDKNGNVIALTDPMQNHWTMAYDAMNRLRSRTDPLGQTTLFTYDASSRLIDSTSPGGKTTHRTYDPRGLLLTVTDPLGATMSYGYDNSGQLVTVTDPRGNVTTIVYDLLHRVAARRDPLAKTATFSYDGNGNLIQKVDRLGRSTLIGYDALNRMKTMAFADATVTYTYDAAGRRTRIDDSSSGSVVWTYDDAGRVLSETQPAGTVQYTYNAAGQRQSLSVADRPAVQYGYDSAGRLSTITQGAEVFTYNYDSLSRLTSLQRPNGIQTTYAYDVANRVSQIAHGSIENLQYTYTPDDKIASISSLASAPLLPSPSTMGPADPANRISQSGSIAFTFDDEGKTVAKTTAQGSVGYTWDARGRLAQVTLPNAQVITYQYDALGRRISRTANGSTTQFLYDGQDVVLDRNSDGSTVDYLNGRRIDEKLRAKSSTAGSLYFLSDHLGSTVALSNGAGAVAENEHYEPYGANGGSGSTRYLYAGRELDQSAGLMYYRARHYDPQIGRFLSEDPLGFAGASNFYVYVGDDPISYRDSLGLIRACKPLDKKGKDCLNKVLAEVQDALKRPVVYLGPTDVSDASGKTDPNRPGWRNGAYNFDFVVPTYTPPAQIGDDCGRFKPTDKRPGSLHIIDTRNNCNDAGNDPTIFNTDNGDFFFTAHIDTAFASGKDPVGWFGGIVHGVGDVLLTLDHGC